MQLPARIGKYELEEFLGGGMSHVYRARDTVIGRTVAVKILTDAACQDTEAKERFLAEARMAGNIEHDNVINIYDFGEDEAHRPFMVMEFLRGETLRQAIDNNHTGDVASKLRIALQAGRALGYIHSQKIIHRDVKPENLHVSTTGLVKLMDFGIAKTEGLQMTRAGFVLGTPYYMTPEQITGGTVTEMVDVYAFGILLFELFTGTRPISGETVERIFYSILNEPINMEPLNKTDAPASVCELIARCAAKNPADRPASFSQICSVIEGALQDRNAPTTILQQKTMTQALLETKPRPKWVLPVAMAGPVVLVALLYLLLYHPDKSGGILPPPKKATTIQTSTGEMVLVPAGMFLFGEKKEQVSLNAFYIDKTEVSNEAYATFCKETGRPLPAQFPKEKPNFPVVNVSILDAQVFAGWAGKRLPSGREWEKAARGTDGRLYPWGNDANPKLANVGSGDMLPVTALPEGASGYGALNMAGNVWELVNELQQPSKRAQDYFNQEFRTRRQPPLGLSDLWYTIRGMSFEERDRLSDNVLYEWTTIPSRWKDANIGFRCAKDAQ